MAKTGASLNRAGSKQNYGTPWDFIRAIERRWGPLAFDLAAEPENAKAPHFYGVEEDAFTQPWHGLGRVFLNPTFSNIRPWAERCRLESTLFRKRKDLLFFLTPASIGSCWFWDHVQPFALVLPLHPRLSFDGLPANPKTGKADPYPKDLMLSVYGAGTGFQRWFWRE